MHLDSRRGFLATVLGPCWTGASLLEQSALRAAHARAQAPAAPSDLFRIERAADGVYAALARPEALLNCNAVIFENSSGLLIVDTHSKPSAAAALAAQIRKEISSKPVRYIVETHFHWDHSQGAAAYRRLAPQAELLSSTATRSLLAELGAARLQRSLEQVPKSLDEYGRKLSAARSAEERSHWEKMLRDTRAYLAEMRNYAPELPDVTFSDSFVIHDKAHDLHLAFRGRGHTAGDVVVFCPQKKVIATGDLVHGFLPFLGDAYPREWPRTLRAVAGFPFETVAGGHGSLQRTRDPFNGMAAYIEELTAAVESGKRQGRTVEELRQTITPASLRALEANGYGRFVAQSLSEYTVDARGKTAARILEDGVRANVADVYQALERT